LLFGIVAVKLMALPGVKYSKKPSTHVFVGPDPTAKSNVSAAAGWVAVAVVVVPAKPEIFPEPIAGLVVPPWYQSQPPLQEAVVHMRVRVTVLSPVVPPAVFAWASPTAGADTQAAMRTARVTIPSLMGGNRRDVVRRIG
jgi:hypothetical protein